VLKLLNEIDWNGGNKEIASEENLDLVEDWYNFLSGGAKKKLFIVSSIIKKPDILMMDEVFNGLDQNSIIKAQQMLKRYLPDTLIIIVDHHAPDNNYGSFYDYEVCFLNKNLVLKEIPPKNISEGLARMENDTDGL